MKPPPGWAKVEIEIMQLVDEALSIADSGLKTMESGFGQHPKAERFTTALRFRLDRIKRLRAGAVNAAVKKGNNGY